MTRVPSAAAHATPGSRAMLLSAIVGAIGVVFVVLMAVAFSTGASAAGMTFGWANDVAVLLQYLLAVPGVLAVGAAMRLGSPRLARLGTALALAGTAAIVVFQALLVTGVLTFAQEVGPASLGILVLGVWMVAAAISGRRSGIGPVGPEMAILAAFYVGHPLWAFRVSRWMRAMPAPQAGLAAPATDAT